MTPEREKEIRDDIELQVPIVEELLAELDRMRGDNINYHVITQENHVLMAERDQLRIELDGWRASSKTLSEKIDCPMDLVEFFEELEQLRTKLEQMTSSIYHTPLSIFGDKSGGDLIAENTQLRAKLDVAVEWIESHCDGTLDEAECPPCVVIAKMEALVKIQGEK